MTLASMNVSNEQYIARFEAGEVAASAFHHADHVRLAFAYLSNFAPLEALNRFSLALRQFAANQGKADRYSETITYAYFFLIRERMARGEHSDWESYARENPDLLRWKQGILNRYYEEPTLKSDLARRVFVFPDKF
ncbi:MAG TPA: hypothetical protein VJO35_15860 [Terriglobales bacterium]|nr:hypothetical protein [Terriglobales bacterium]